MFLKKSLRILSVLALLLLCSGCFEKIKEESAIKAEGIKLLQEGSYEEALVKFDEALRVREGKKIDAARADILKYRAEAEFLLEDYAAADHTYQQLAESGEGGAEFNAMRVICLSRQGGDLSKAKELYRRMLSSSADEELNFKTLCELTDALARSENGTKEALEYYYVYLEDPSKLDSRLCSHIGNLYLKDEDYMKAIEFFSKGLAMDADEETKKSMMFNLAVCHEYISDFPKALELFDQYVKEYGGEEAALHEISFIKSRIRE
ncbi:MAG: tetratricopeptide repeat protein [Johnsonella sp.]|nr:tetratricopeptide repeat protein [Johnsonella sp.]